MEHLLRLLRFFNNIKDQYFSELFHLVEENLLISNRTKPNFYEKFKENQQTGNENH